MTCPNCATSNDTDARYCKRCAQPLSGDLFPAQAPAYPRSDRGFLLLAILYFVNAANWLACALWLTKYFSNPLDAQRWGSLIGLLLNCCEVVLMVVYTKRPRYRTAILLLSGAFILAELALVLPAILPLFR
ncbi:MAG: hypothetical protein EOP50_12775 [Sphingobacteriales bacterium]|nr:MAG: hypothetical protein EOP50_12775 [Sphingobacteriales bacterium]